MSGLDRERGIAGGRAAVGFVFAAARDQFRPVLDGVQERLELARKVGIATYEAELSRADLLAADEVFLTGSVRGIERIKSLDGAAIGGPGKISERLATELQLAWTGAKAAPLR